MLDRMSKIMHIASSLTSGINHYHNLRVIYSIGGKKICNFLDNFSFVWYIRN